MSDDFSDDPGAHTSHRNPSNVTRYADASMYPAAPMRATLPKVTVITATPDPLGVIAAVSRMYKGLPFYDASDLRRITNAERREVWQDMSQTTLDTPLEFIKLHFLVEGVTRALTHQMVRQRTAVYAQESLRFAVKDDLAEACQMPPSIAMLPKRDERRLTWQRAMADAQLWYHTLIENGIPAEDARSVLPHAVTTRLHYATDLRNLRREVAKRTCTQAQFEWRHLVTSMREALGEYEGTEGDLPDLCDNWQWRWIARDLVKPPCFAAGHCTFNASFDRPCSIKPKVDAGQFDQIDELEYLADPRAAWDVRDE
jgi:flavin-dependent thymidylate synthase